MGQVKTVTLWMDHQDGLLLDWFVIKNNGSGEGIEYYLQEVDWLDDKFGYGPEAVLTPGGAENRIKILSFCLACPFLLLLFPYTPNKV